MIINRLNELLNNTEHEDINHVIAKYMKKHFTQIPYMTIEEIANGCFVSKSKISMFCKRLGYDHFHSFKNDCLKDVLAKQEIIDHQSIPTSKNYLDYLYTTFYMLEKKFSQLDENDIKKLVNDIHHSKHIFVYGIAYSHLLCEYIQYEGEFINKEVIVMDELLQRDYVMKDDSLMIIISIEGYAFENDHRLLRKLKQYSVHQWLLTTDLMNKKIIDAFDDSLIVQAQDTELRMRRLFIRCLIDVILEKYQHLYL
ncbi:MurR/RpiR family transcriptional regulator [Coprobacillus sp. AF09-1A]|nr:MurR/RpiR family transcriptional regulator [Coprobacillus sp. AF09-1A]